MWLKLRIVNDIPEESGTRPDQGRATGPVPGEPTGWDQGSSCVPSSAEPKYLSGNRIRLILYDSGPESVVLGVCHTCGKIGCVVAITPPQYGAGLLEVIFRRRGGGSLFRHNEKPPAKARSAPRSWNVEVGGPVGGEACEEQGGGPPAAETTPCGAVAGLSRGCCGAGTGHGGRSSWDSPPGRHEVYDDLDARGGQSHVN